MDKVSDLPTRLSKLLTGSMSATQLAEIIGMSKQTISAYTTGVRSPKRPAINAMATALGVNPLWLMGYDVPKYNEIDASAIPPGFLPLPETERLPLVGRIACGTPILAEENIDDYVDVPKAARATFVLLCQGDSMSPRIQDGDYVYVRKQPAVENGELAAVRIGTEATLKRVYFSPESPDRLILQAENPAYAPMIYTGQDLEDVSIEGKIVGIYRNMEHP